MKHLYSTTLFLTLQFIIVIHAAADRLLFVAAGLNDRAASRHSWGERMYKNARGFNGNKPFNPVLEALAAESRRVQRFSKGVVGEIPPEGFERAKGEWKTNVWRAGDKTNNRYLSRGKASSPRLKGLRDSQAEGKSRIWRIDNHTTPLSSEISPAQIYTRREDRCGAKLVSIEKPFKQKKNKQAPTSKKNHSRKRKSRRSIWTVSGGITESRKETLVWLLRMQGPSLISQAFSQGSRA